MNPFLSLASVERAEYVEFDLLSKSRLRPQVSMRSEVQSDLRHVLVYELIVADLARIQIQDVVMHLIRPRYYVLLDAICDDFVDFFRKVASEKVEVLRILEFSPEDSSGVEPLILIA